MNGEIYFQFILPGRVSLLLNTTFTLKRISDLQRAIASLGPGEMTTDHLRASSKASSFTFSMPFPLSLACMFSTFLGMYTCEIRSAVPGGEGFSPSPATSPASSPELEDSQVLLQCWWTSVQKHHMQGEGRFAILFYFYKPTFHMGEKVSLNSWKLLKWGGILMPGALRQILGYIFGFKVASKSLQMLTGAMKLKEICSLEEKLWPT